MKGKAVWWKKRIAVLAVVICVGGNLYSQPPADALQAKVSLVIDGDTVVLDNGEYVRYLGIDTPEEGEPFYWAAKRLNRKLVWRKTVYLEVGEERRDGYGRLLAYIWVEQDGEWILVNEEILRHGLARLLVIWPDHYHPRLIRALTLAQVEKRGLWGKYRDVLTLAELEEKPQRYVTEAITLLFRVEAVEVKGSTAIVRAASSRYGFHVLVNLGVLKELGLSRTDLIGETICVSGELRWENLSRGPYIQIYLPIQLVSCAGSG